MSRSTSVQADIVCLPIVLGINSHTCVFSLLYCALSSLPVALSFCFPNSGTCQCSPHLPTLIPLFIHLISQYPVRKLINQSIYMSVWKACGLVSYLSDTLAAWPQFYSCFVGPQSFSAHLCLSLFNSHICADLYFCQENLWFNCNLHTTHCALYLCKQQGKN